MNIIKRVNEEIVVANIRVRHRGKFDNYIHNDLLNGAFHFKRAIDQKITKGDRVGIAFDCMACLTLLAFAFEAHLNFYGDKLIDGWNERQNSQAKFAAITEKLGIPVDNSKKPFQSVKELSKFRNLVGHGKPEIQKFDRTLDVPEERFDRIKTDLAPQWLKQCNEQVVARRYDDVKVICKLLLEKSGFNLFDTLSGGVSVKSREL